MQPIIVFDVNETLLDLGPVRIWFSERFGNQPDVSTWFSELLRLTFVSSVLDRYHPFTDLAAAALETTTAIHGADTTEDDMKRIRGILATLPPHEDVAQGLDRLHGTGFTVAALTNSPQGTAETQLENAGIADLFDAVMSVDMVRRFKPHSSVYRAAAQKLGVATSDLVMVAAHDWDVAGAMASGCAGVFITRPGQVYSPSLDASTMTATDIHDAAGQIIARYA
ncbi:MAG: haloacid dehalogenase type II [Acidimicrobiia bacterium]|nr:MAG: haloacid dehalogenase type II [Acidimicrobiia bacterium]